eukprot:Gb_13095 [translate_table: standard]
MAGKEHSKKPRRLLCKAAVLVFLFCTALWFVFSVSHRLKWVYRETVVDSMEHWNGNLVAPEKRYREVSKQWNSCDFSSGRWVQDANTEPRYDEMCKEIFKGWNCIANNKSNAREILKWRWQPWECDLPRLDPILFLERFRDTSIGNLLFVASFYYE